MSESLLIFYYFSFPLHLFWWHLRQEVPSVPASPASSQRVRAPEGRRTTTTATCRGCTCVHPSSPPLTFPPLPSPSPSLSLLPRPQIMILLCNQQSFICTHIDFCHPRCYQHHSRSCARLVRAIKLVYGETVDSLREDSTAAGNIGARTKKNKEVSRLVFAAG